MIGPGRMCDPDQQTVNMRGNEATEGHTRRRLTPAEFRDVIGHFASGVTVVTSVCDGRRFGTTASAVTSLSLEPPMVLVCLDHRSATGQAVATSRRFAVAILGEDQADIAVRFAKSAVNGGADQFADAPVIKGSGDVPVLAEALATLECRVVEQTTGGTHLVFLGEVDHGSARAGTPLAYYRGQFGRLELDADTTAYQDLRLRIVNRDIEVGEPLDLSQVAQQIGVPRGAAYHALDKLAGDGLVFRDDRGAFVVRALEWDMIESAVRARAVIEKGVAVSIYSRLSKADLAEMERLCRGTDPMPGGRAISMAEWRVANAAFHEHMIGLGGGTTAAAAYHRVNVPAMMAGIETERAGGGAVGGVRAVDTHATEAFRTHKAIVAAFRRRDLDGILQAMDDHNAVALSTFERALGSRRG